MKRVSGGEAEITLAVFAMYFRFLEGRTSERDVLLCASFLEGVRGEAGDFFAEDTVWRRPETGLAFWRVA